MKNIYKVFCSAIAILIISHGAYSQMVISTMGSAINDPSAILDLQSTSMGFLSPRMTSAQIAIIPSPANGLMVYQTDGTPGYYYNTGTTVAPVWNRITDDTTPIGYWTQTGSDIYYTTGNVGIGVSNPSTKLDVSGPAHILDSLYIDGRPGRLFLNGQTNFEPTVRYAYEGSTIFKQKYRLGDGTLGDPYFMLDSYVSTDIFGVTAWGRMRLDYVGSSTASLIYSAGNGSAQYINNSGTGGDARGINVSISSTSAPSTTLSIGAWNYGAGSAVYGENDDQGNFGYLGTTNHGAYGQFGDALGSSNFGTLGSSSYGAYGEHGTSDNRGYLGGANIGAYGIDDGTGYWGALGVNGVSDWGVYGDDGVMFNPNYGGIATALHGASGYNGNGNWGALGSNSYGVYGEHDDNHWGALGTTDYGAYGIHDDGHYGALGTTNEGVFGIHNDDHYGSLGTETAGVVGTLYRSGSQPLSNGDYAIKGNGVTSNDDDGTGYAYGDNVGAVIGYNAEGSTYSFGVTGYTEDVNENRSGGVFGSDHSGNNWGSLAYRASDGTMYGGYFTTMDSSSTEKLSSQAKANIGISARGDLMGAHVSGSVYGLYAEGSNYSIYASGDMYRTGADVHLQQNNNGENTVMYTQVSTEMTVQTYGIGSMQGGKSSIVFDQAFSDVVSTGEPIIVTITPIGETKGVYLQNVDGNGFAVSENNNGKSNVQFSWIAIGKRKGYENISLPRDVINGDYTQKVRRGLSNDNDQDKSGEGLYYENGTLHNGRIQTISTNNNNSSEFRTNVALEPAVKSPRNKVDQKKTREAPLTSSQAENESNHKSDTKMK